MNNDHGGEMGIGVLIAIILVGAVIGLALYLFGCFCFKRICEKCGTQPGFLIWIPFLNCICLLQAARMSGWLIIPAIIPPVGFIIAIIMWVKVCEIRQKSTALVVGLVLLPIIFVPYLAFSE